MLAPLVMESSLNGLIGFASQFESQESHFCWENLCLPSSRMGCGIDLNVSSTEALPRPSSRLGCDINLKASSTEDVFYIDIS